MSNPSNLSNTTSTRERIEGRINPDKAAAISVGNSGAMTFANASDVMEFAKIMSVSGVAIPKHLRENPGACMAVIIQASEWRMSPFAVANKSYSVNDRLAYEAQLVAAVILRRAPIKGRFKVSYAGEGDRRKCTVAVMTTDDEPVDYESPAFGTITPKNSPLWKSDPDQQLYYYTSRALCRRHFPDVLLGVYTMDEMIDANPIVERQATGRVVTGDTPRIAQNPFADEPGPRVEEESVQDRFEDLPAGQDAEPPLESPVEVGETAERAQLVSDIRAMLAEENTTLAKYAPMCRGVGLLAAGVQLPEMPIESLRIVHENRRAILIGEYIPA